MIEYFDTHCHIQFKSYPLDTDQVIKDAVASGVTKMLSVGCTLEDSKLAVKLARHCKNIWAAIGLHPHEAKKYVNNNDELQAFRDLAGSDRVVAVGEIGLDYYYGHSSRQDQLDLLRYQLTIAEEFRLPILFHVRGSKAFDGQDVWRDFWPIFDEFKPKGVIHSFSSTPKELEAILKRDLFVGLNGIMTFTKNSSQLESAKQVPLDNILLETDAPFLTPSPFRGTICQPKHVVDTATFLSDLRGETLQQIAESTTKNANRLCNLV
ncbi:TatD family hydrolase [Candidatus Saccharibacteria bacterium]|nr:TatD family hydrolase [Candidatus Saccharibacteria bacterium]